MRIHQFYSWSEPDQNGNIDLEATTVRELMQMRTVERNDHLVVFYGLAKPEDTIPIYRVLAVTQNKKGVSLRLTLSPP